MVITLAEYVAQASQAGAPDKYINDFLVSDYYDVMLVDDWETSGSPTAIKLLLWRKLDGQDTVAAEVILLGDDETGQTITVPTGQSVTLRIPGKCAFVAVTVVMAGGTSPTFTGNVLADGNFSDGGLF